MASVDGAFLTAEPVGRVIGTEDAFALSFWVYVRDGRYLQLDDVVTVPVDLPDGQSVRLHGIVDTVRSRFEGARFDSDADAASEQRLPVGVAHAAHVTVTRVEPEIFVAPSPGAAAYRSEATQRDEALYFDQMIAEKTAFVAGLARDGQRIYGNLEFLDGTRGAHMNISGISGVATKTSYALFLLYSLLGSGVLGQRGSNAKSIIFNVKGEDLLWLDKPNNRLDERARDAYARMGLPVGPFRSVRIWAPAQKGGDLIIPASASRQEGVLPFCWSLSDFCRERMLRFLFAEADSETSQISFVIRLVEEWLARPTNVLDPDDRGFVSVNGVELVTARSFPELVDAIEANLPLIAQHAAEGTRQAFIRRLFDAAATAGHLVRALTKEERQQHTIRVLDADAGRQVTVIDINNLPDRAKRFVVGVVVRRLVEQTESGAGQHGLTFLVLDELNKYAPRDGWSPIKEVILDIAERGRSLGVILIGAQQTASEVERRVTANASFRVAGRLDTAEAARAEYGFLTDAAKARASILKPGTMFVHQPEIPVPLLVQFPFPAWATRKSEVDSAGDAAGEALRGGLLQ
ncbi:MAG: ATP-binding protein [Dehalococcoidia bacterium]|nr:ATP-binding protein [Dehalococcoidia bacterium]